MNARLYAVPKNDGCTDREGDLVIDVARLNKTFGKNRVLKNINLKVREGEMVGLIGASGSGKSTLIREIGGLETMDSSSGHVKLFGEATQIGNKKNRQTPGPAPRCRYHFPAVQPHWPPVGIDQCAHRTTGP